MLPNHPSGFSFNVTIQATPIPIYGFSPYPYAVQQETKKRKTRAEQKEEARQNFFRKCHEVHGNRYDYSQAIYKGRREKITIICHRYCDFYGYHGSFQMRPDVHADQRSGCQKCSGNLKHTTETFTKKANEVHNGKYTYPRTKFERGDLPVIVTCPRHEEDFLVTPYHHISNRNGCPKCNPNRAITNEEWKARMTERHGGFYKYDKANYTNKDSPVTIYCPLHDYFETTAHNHMYNGTGCEGCNPFRLKTLDEFKQQSKALHGDDAFDYSPTKYINDGTKLEMICNSCKKSFWMRPSDHLRKSAPQGCSKCRKSKGEKRLWKILDEKKVQYVPEYSDPNCQRRWRWDIYFYNPKNQRWYLIDYGGVQHFKRNSQFHKQDGEFELQQQNDVEKTLAYYNAGYYIIHIDYTCLDKLEQTITDAVNSDCRLWFSNSKMYDYIIKHFRA